MKAIITYEIVRSYGIQGQQAGANGSGEYAIIFESTDIEHLQKTAHKKARDLAMHPEIKNIMCVCEEERYFGPAIIEINLDIQKLDFLK